MPRNASGIYSLPAGNPVVPGTVIASDWANPTMNDIAAALTDSLSRSGFGAMQANLGMGGYKILNVANGILPTDGANIANVDSIAGAKATASMDAHLAAPDPHSQYVLGTSRASYSEYGLAQFATNAEALSGVDQLLAINPWQGRVYAQVYWSVQELTANRTLNPSTDVNSYFYNYGNGDITVTTPSSGADQFTVGSRVDIFNAGNGRIKLAPGSGTNMTREYDWIYLGDAVSLVYIGNLTWHAVGKTSP
jgi:hypothetical protein